MTEPSTDNPRHSSRASLRHATFIDPQTGARLQRRFTLHGQGLNREASGSSESPETVPLSATGDNNFDALAQNASRLTKYKRLAIHSLRRSREFITSETGKGIFKCAVAYTLGSMATFVPFLSSLFGRSDSKHLVATITVYFHPARSLGSMIEALMLASIAFCYTAALSMVSMSIAVFFTDTAHLIVLSHIVVLILFVGGGLGFVAWVKLKRGDALVNIACSLCSLTLITILTKEGAVQAGDYSFAKISQMLKMLIAGVIATSLVNISVFPISGRTNLKQNMLDVTDALSDMLALITSSFISGDEAELEDEVLAKVSERHKKSSAKIAQNLKESRYEHYLMGTEVQAAIEARLANCIQRISQSVGGLRTAAAMQFTVIKQIDQNTHGPRHAQSVSQSSVATTPSFATAQDQRTLSRDFQMENIDQVLTSEPDQQEIQVEQQSPRTPSQIFDLFIDHLGPSMRSLAYTLKEILDDLPFDASAGYKISVNPKLKLSLERALELYKAARRDALDAVYDKKEMDRRRPMAVEADWEEAAACCGHFSCSLLDVAEDVKKYLIILDEMHLELEEEPSGRSWSWLKFWEHDPTFDDVRRLEADLEPSSPKIDKPGFELRPVSRFQVDDAHGSPASRTWKQLKRLYFRKVYENCSFLRRDDIKYAIKVGFGAILYAMPSFIPATRPFYSHWRGEWGLLSYMLVCSMTIGASNTTGYSRILGTALGAMLAIVFWHVADGNAILLIIFGFAMAYWTAWIVIGKGKGPMGRFIILTYNLSALYAYSLTIADDEDDEDEEDRSNKPLIAQIAGHRFAAVVSGCIWGLIITRAVWPISAREKLKEQLSLLWLRMGLIWKRDPLSVLLEGEQQDQYLNLREEFELQRFLSTLEELVEAAKSEFELRSIFPHETYSRMLKSTGKMLDAFHTMNVVLLKDMSASSGETALLKATAKERSQLCSRISHLFTVLSSSMKLEYPLATDALPNIEHTRERLLAAIFAYRRQQAEQHHTSDEDFGILYTYALVTGQLSIEIQAVMKEVESLFGILDEEALRLQ